MNSVLNRLLLPPIPRVRRVLRAASSLRSLRLFASIPLLLLSSMAAFGQSDYISRTDYRNEIYTNTPVFTTNSFLLQTNSVAFYSGNIGDAPNSPNPTNSAKATTPNDGANYLLQSIIGQPIGVATAPFTLVTNGIGTLTSVPNPYPATNWYQLGQAVTLTAQPGRYFIFAGWLGGGTNTVTNVVVGAANFYQANFVTNGSPLETNVVNGVTRIVPFGTPLVLLNELYYSNNVVPATNGTMFTMTLTNSFAGGTNYYYLNGSSLNNYTGAVPVTAPFSITAIGRSQDGLASAQADPVNTLSATSPGGGTVSVASQADVYTGASSAILTGLPANGWSFLNWTGDGNGTSTNLTVTMNGPKSVQGIFGTALMTGAGSGAGGTVFRSPDQTLYSFGTSVRLSALPDSTNYFQEWGANNYLNHVGDSPVDFVVTNAYQTNLANFAQLGNNKVSLTLFKNGSGTLSVNPLHPSGWFYNTGTQVALTASNDPGQSFIGWTGGTYSTNNPLVITMNSSMVITGSFAITQPQFALLTNAYTVNESDGSLQIPVVNFGVLDGKVQFATADQSAVGIAGNSGDYTNVQTTLYFTNGIHTNIVSIGVRDEFLLGTNRTFLVVLSNPQPLGSSTNAALGTPSAAVVSILYNDSVSTNGSELVQLFRTRRRKPAAVSKSHCSQRMPTVNGTSHGNTAGATAGAWRQICLRTNWVTMWNFGMD